MELKGTRGLFDTVKTSRMWNVATVLLRLAVLTRLFWGTKQRRFGRAPPDLAPAPRAATGEFLAQNLDVARAPPRLQDDHMLTGSEALGRSNGQNGTETCCCCLLVS